MGFIPDSKLKTILIPVQIKNGIVSYFYDGPLPKIAEDTIGDLIIPESAIEDKEIINFLTEERRIEIFPAGTTFFVELKPYKVDCSIFLALPIGSSDKSHGKKYATVVTKEPLYIILRAAKRPRLESVRCKIPLLNNVEATSLNHAYTLLSQEFEKDRISHVSNVFNTVYFQHPYSKRYYPLDDIRNDRKLLYDRTLKTYKFKNIGDTPSLFDFDGSKDEK